MNSDVGESQELASLSSGFRDCSTGNVITCTRIEANIEKSLSKSQNRTRLSRQSGIWLFQQFFCGPPFYIPDCYSTSGLMLKNMAAALPRDSGEGQSAEELENIIEWIAIFYQMVKTKQVIIMNEKRHITTSNRTEVYFRPHVNVKLAFSFA